MEANGHRYYRSKTIEVPAIGDFKVLNVMAMNDAEQYASVQFSDPIALGQELTGLIPSAINPIFLIHQRQRSKSVCR